MAVTKISRHVRCTRVNFSDTVLTLGLKAKTCEKCMRFISDNFGENCARAPCLTASILYMIVVNVCSVHNFGNLRNLVVRRDNISSLMAWKSSHFFHLIFLPSSLFLPVSVDNSS